MAGIMEIIIKAVDQISPTIDKIKGTTGGATSFMEANWKKVGLATAGAATAIEMLARANAPLVELTRRLADNLNITEGAMKKLTLETSNYSFPLKEVLELMELGTKQGLDSAEALKEYADFWDMVSDATGESSTALAEAGVSLKALGIAAGEEGKALNAFGFIQRNTTMEIGEFINSIGRLAPEMRELKVGVNEAAVILGILQQEFGMTSRVAMQEFRTAVTSADGDIDKLKETLGITGEMFDTYSQKVEESSDVISENARRNNELYTTMQKFQHWLGEVKYAMSGYIETLAKFAPALYAIGPAMKLFSVGAHAIHFVMSGQLIPTIIAMTAKTWAFTAAILANPLTWWVLGIMAVVGAIVLLWKNWEKVSEFITKKIDWICSKFEWLGDKIKWVAEKLGIYKQKTEEIIDSTDDLNESIETANTSIDNFKVAQDEALVATGALTEGVDGLGESLDKLPEKAVKASDSIKLYAEDVGEDYIQLAGRSTDSWADFYAFWEAEAKRTADEVEKTLEIVIDKWGVAHKVWTEKAKDITKDIAKASTLYKVVDAEGKTLGLRSGNILSQAEKEAGVKLIKLHEGTWKVRTAVPGGEGIAVLKDKEVISQEDSRGWKGAHNQINLEIKTGAFQFNANKLDEGVIRNAGKLLFDEIFNQCRAHGISLAKG